MLDRLEIFNRLLQDHVTARRVMAALDAEVDRVAQFHPPGMAAIDQAVSFFTGYMAGMHHPIEDMIFTALSREAPAKAAELKKVAEEHDEAGALVSQLVEVVGELKADSDRSRAAFCRVARGLIAFERHHLRREESRFFIYAGEHLTPVAWRNISVTARALEKTMTEDSAEAPAVEDNSQVRRSRRGLAEIRR